MLLQNKIAFMEKAADAATEEARRREAGQAALRRELCEEKERYNAFVASIAGERELAHAHMRGVTRLLLKQAVSRRQGDEASGKEGKETSEGAVAEKEPEGFHDPFDAFRTGDESPEPAVEVSKPEVANAAGMLDK